MEVLAIVIKLLAFAVAGSIFVIPRPYKAGMMMVSYLLFSHVFFGGLSAMGLTSICFFISELFRYRKCILILKDSRPFRVYLLAVFLLMLSTILFSEHLHDVKEIVYYIVGEGIEKFAIILVGLLTVSKRKHLVIIYKIVFITMMIVSVFALLNILFRHSIYIEAIYETTSRIYDFNSATRFRVQATFLNPFDYGFSCVLFLLFSGYLFLKRNINLAVFSIASAISLLGIISCGCRTVFAVFLVSTIVVLICVQKNFGARALIAGIIVLTLGISYVSLSPVKKMINMSISMFDKEATVSGSSIEGRMMQLLAVFGEIRGNMAFGNGYQYFTKDVGWSEDGTYFSSNPDLLGLEGVYLNYLLERGFVGFILYIVMICATVQMLRRHSGDRVNRAFAMTILLAYLMFAFMTGELLSFQPTFLLIGCFLALPNRTELGK